MNRPDQRIEAISVDVDGTLYGLRRMVLRHLPSFVRWRRFFRSLHRVRDEMRGQPPVADFRAVQAERLALALDITPEQAAALVVEIIDRRWMELFVSLRTYPTVAETLRGLAQRGLKLAVLSDYPAWPKLGGLGLVDLPWACVINTEQIGALKPHPAAFEKVSELLGVEPARILHVGDIERNDVDGALSAGMQAARVYEGSRPRTRAAFAFRDWRSLVPLLRLKGMLE
jgi:putative hydrolase of the HAD superfamily